MKSWKQAVESIVESRGYGPWYQWQAWQTVKSWPIDPLVLFTYLNERYPPIVGAPDYPVVGIHGGEAQSCQTPDHRN